jgi:hypothetical protein
MNTFYAVLIMRLNKTWVATQFFHFAEDRRSPDTDYEHGIILQHVK